MSVIIELKGMGKTFTTSNGSVTALDDINLQIEKGEIFGIIGLSGAGKSTLVRCINFLEEPTSGSVIFKGKNLGTLSQKDLRASRREMSMIFQQFNLLEQRNVLRNVTFPLELVKTDRKKAEEKAMQLLKIVGLDDRAKAYPSQLSGGQKQRVAIARALASDPEVILCDEATSALDPKTTKQILELLKKINKEMGVTVIVITHEMKVIEAICDKVAIIDSSHIAETGPVSQIFASPKTPIGRRLILGDDSRHDEIHEHLEGARKLRLVFEGSTYGEPIISALSKQCNASVNIVFANLNQVEGRTVGQMVIELPEDSIQQADIISFLKARAVKFEEVKS
ncbi:MAG: ATP-binding cassette domain-containing protein [Eubacteriales bacterium]|nr:ATP-binding cassette domain-containing protein [Eubacteriales bacterium]